ncbi:NADH-ubiquinone oxidoreductase-F iron-sulfur binding region domain-containing protein [Fodinicurvata fenggangensis]|uniref:NADH-ubiquinone oxidoreductase-F iron-sulfur binding region domain-containing protein n=1 Tax=Fodinicurvata fenggangensis TaxID=1121830 RepID=UPI00068FE612|nr:NADH-ubiquinone oxidoreductase-F iron-sulfur binding region domain-containing protein [Fodinicurvata fenggangensis]
MSQGQTAPTSQAERQIHPGSGRRKAPLTPKGRQAESEALDQVRALLGERSRQPDLLIEHLHLVQDSYGCLSAAHLAALAEEMKLPLAAVYETASFYAHFDIIEDGETPPAPITVRVCESLTCEMMGAQRLIEELEADANSEVRILRAPCMGRCDTAPVAEVGHHHVDHASRESISTAISDRQMHPEIPDYKDFDSYRAEGGYRLLQRILDGELTREDIIATMKEADLRGLGGAGFRAGLKWQIMQSQVHPRLMAINGDEGEPGTFKDRYFLESDPHRFIEGMLIGAWVGACETSYIYIRDEYPAVIEILKRELPKVELAGLADHCRMEIRRGAGAYICGEESAMLESIEGKRGYPRHKPPFPTEVGLFGLPTLTHNVETVYWVRDILEKGAEWFTSQGRHDRKGLRSFSVSGRVHEPGVKLAPAGITIRELIEEYCGGMAEGYSFKGYLPGGASGGILPASMDDIPLDFDTLQPHGCFIGSAAIVVLSDQDDIKEVVRNLMRFFEDESCGQCTPCRNGTEKAVQLLDAKQWDTDLLEELSSVMMDSSICGLGQAAPNPLLCALKYFPEESRS